MPTFKKIKKLLPHESKVHFVEKLRQIQLPKSSIVIGDRKIPLSIRKVFPKAIWVQGGETAKRLLQIEKLAEKVLQKEFHRNMTLVALGGGSLGDAIGFLASTLWRGVPLIHIPTTGLAMVDSAHGGKTAVNLPQAKNQLGTFYAAQEIWIVREILEGLPGELKREAWVETFKAALLGNSQMAKLLFRSGFENTSLWPMVRKAIGIKREVCKRDPFEEFGARHHLNLGHTLGHALEIHTDLSHGDAVAWGLASASLLSERFGFGYCHQVWNVLRDVLQKPGRWPQETQLRNALRLDKKSQKKELSSVILTDLGKPKVTSRIKSSDWLHALKEVRREMDL